MPSTSQSRVRKTGRDADMGVPPMPMMGHGEAVGLRRGPPHERPDGTISPTARGSMRLRRGGPRRHQDRVRRSALRGEIHDAARFARSISAAPLGVSRRWSRWPSHERGASVGERSRRVNRNIASRARRGRASHGGVRPCRASASGSRPAW